jgi:hypothetical protein
MSLQYKLMQKIIPKRKWHGLGGRRGKRPANRRPPQSIFDDTVTIVSDITTE